MVVSVFGNAYLDPVYSNRAPLPTDNIFQIAQQWVDESVVPNVIYQLVYVNNFAPYAADWVVMGSGGSNPKMFRITDPDITATAVTLTAADNRCTVAAPHGFLPNMTIVFDGVGLPPAVLPAPQVYYVVNPTPLTFQISLLPGGVPVAFGVDGNGDYYTFNGPTATPIIDFYDGAIVTTTTGPIPTMILMPPTNTLLTKVFWVQNDVASTDDIIIQHGTGTVTLIPGQGQKYMWDGAAWGVGSGIDADDVDYVPSGLLTATNVQAAIDQLVTAGYSIRTYADVATAELATLATAMTHWIYVTATDTLYHYSATSGETRDGTYILNTGTGAATRWVAISGQYAYRSHVKTFGYESVEKETADRTIYLATTGSDTTGDGTVGSPYFSIHRALLDIKQGAVLGTTYAARVTIQLAAGSYDFSALGDLDFSRFFQSHLIPRIQIIGVDGTLANAFSVDDTGTVDAGSNTEYCSVHLNTGKAWVANAYAGKFMVATSFRSGSVPSVEMMKFAPIYSNTANTLKTAFFGTTANLDVENYSIVTPLVSVSFGSNRIILPISTQLSIVALSLACGKIVSDAYSSNQMVSAPALGGAQLSLQQVVVVAAEMSHYVKWSVVASYLGITTGASTCYLDGSLQNTVITTAKSSSSAGQFAFYTVSFLHCVFVQTGASKYYMSSSLSSGANVVISGPIRLVGFHGLLDTGHSNTTIRARCMLNFCRYDNLRPSAWLADNAKSLIYLYNRSGLTITTDKNSKRVVFVNEPTVGRVTADNTTDLENYYDEENDINALAIASDAKQFKTFCPSLNADADSGTEEVDYFYSGIGAKGVRWDITASKTGAIKRICSISACWNSASTEIADSGEYGIVNIGDTTGISFTVTRETTGPGTVSNAAGGTTVTGVGTRFLNTFKVGDKLTIGADTVTVTAITSATVMTTTAITSAHAAGTAYTFPDRVSLNAVATTNDWEVRAQRYLV